tara:strand:- start:97 stop:1239 length:1143 start_codon:yes stop_codon:yes gene_type:complete
MSIINPVAGIGSDEKRTIPDALVPNYGPYYYPLHRGQRNNVAKYHDEVQDIIVNNHRMSRGNPCQLAIIKRYTVVNKLITGRPSGRTKKDMMKLFGRIINVQTHNLTVEEESYLNYMHELCFQKQVDVFKTQLYYMKNNIGVFRDPIFPESRPWIIPKFTFDCEKSDTYKKAHVFVINQEFHRGNPLIHNEVGGDSFIFWQFKHYDKFFISDPSVTWGFNDIALHNILYDVGTRQICYVDNAGFKQFNYDIHNANRYKIMCMINPNIGEYLPGKDCNTPREVIANDYILHDSVKIFFKKLFLYEKIIFNFRNIGQIFDRERTSIDLDAFDKLKEDFNTGSFRYQNWFHHEGDRVMNMTDEYVAPRPNLKKFNGWGPFTAL